MWLIENDYFLWLKFIDESDINCFVCLLFFSFLQWYSGPCWCKQAIFCTVIRGSNMLSKSQKLFQISAISSYRKNWLYIDTYQHETTRHKLIKRPDDPLFYNIESSQHKLQGITWAFKCIYCYECLAVDMHSIFLSHHPDLGTACDICDHSCINSISGVKCICNIGYTLDGDGATCNGEN